MMWRQILGDGKNYEFPSMYYYIVKLKWKSQKNLIFKSISQKKIKNAVAGK